MPARFLPAALIGSSAVLLVVAGLLPASGAGFGAPAEATTERVAAPTPPRNGLEAAIHRAQERLRLRPADDHSWAELGQAYVQQARITSDPSYYPKAEQALRRSLRLRPAENTAAMVGLGALANARHDFRAARDWGRRAEAVDRYNGAVYGVLTDALTQLGDYPGAEAAAQRMLDLQPGLSSFTRAAYVFEQRGDIAAARSALTRALAEATAPADIAFCRLHLGDLAFDNGDPKAASEQYQQGLTAAPETVALLAGRARATAALGRTEQALRDLATVVERAPLPEYVLEHAELLDSLGRPEQARGQYRLLASIQRLFTVNGVLDDLGAAQIEADHGSPATAVRLARAEWARRHSVLVADALAWALHRAGDDRQALSYAKQADRLGWRNAGFAYHRGMIELGLGDRRAARRDLDRALRINPHFSRLHAPRAAAALASLGGTR
jgi:tetratricopeptide (TPR) repeat protein